jgi:hypothetical protein
MSAVHVQVSQEGGIMTDFPFKVGDEVACLGNRSLSGFLGVPSKAQRVVKILKRYALLDNGLKINAFGRTIPRNTFGYPYELLTEESRSLIRRAGLWYGICNLVDNLRRSNSAAENLSEQQLKDVYKALSRCMPKESKPDGK